jgi:hypothetical protein
MTLFVERRAFPRCTVRTPGEISFAAPGSKLKSYVCTVVNISQGGALIETALPDVPDQLTLNFRGQMLAAEVVGRNGGRVHLKLADAPQE